jgi:uncharacterized protein involved in exopolysaccharide biosynthesis
MNDTTLPSGNLRGVLFIIFKYKLLIILCIFFSLSLAFYINSKYKPIFMATAKLLVKIGRENIETQTTPLGTSKASIAPNKERLNNEIEIIKSRKIAESVINKIGIENIYPGLPIQVATMLFKSSVHAAPVRDSNIINVSFAHRDRKNVAEFLNLMIEQYIDHHLKIYQQSEIQVFFDNQVEILNNKRITTSNELHKLKEKYNISELNKQKDILLRQIYSFKNDQTNIEIKISEEQSKLNAQLEKEMSGADMGVLEERYNPVAINTVKTRLNNLKLELEELRVRYSDDNVLIKNVKKEIENAEKLYESELKSYYNKTKITLQDSIESLKIKNINTGEQVTKLQKELFRLNKVEQNYSSLKRQDELNIRTYALYVNRLEEERISGAMDAQRFSNIYIIEKAYPPIKPVRQANKKSNLLISLLIGTALGIFIAFLIEYFNHCFNDRDDIIEHLQLKVLASIPEYKQKDAP